METMIERLIRYCKVNTRSDETSKSVPSTLSQVEFAKMLAKELETLGFSEVTHRLDNGFVTATIPSNTHKPVDTLGFIAHFDTADFNSENVNPQTIFFIGIDNPIS